MSFIKIKRLNQCPIFFNGIQESEYTAIEDTSDEPIAAGQAAAGCVISCVDDVVKIIIQLPKVNHGIYH